MDENGRIRLLFKGLSRIVGEENAHMLMLTNEQETRLLTVPCDDAMAEQFSLRSKRVPNAGRLLPEVLWQMLSAETESDFELLITGLMEGEYLVFLCNTASDMRVAIRACDAVLLSFSENVPIYIDEALFQKQSYPYQKQTGALAVPVNTLSDELVQKALQKAIDEEEYELASRLRDELARRAKEENE